MGSFGLAWGYGIATMAKQQSPLSLASDALSQQTAGTFPLDCPGVCSNSYEARCARRPNQGKGNTRRVNKILVVGSEADVLTSALNEPTE